MDDPDGPRGPSTKASEFPVRGEAPGQAHLRRFRRADTEAVVTLHDEAFRAAGTDPGDVPGIADLRWIEEAYLDTGGEFLVVETPDRHGEATTLVAVGGLLVDGRVGELFRVAVDPSHQREGYGSALLDGLELAALDRGVERLVLTTASRQTAAVEFYMAHGYEETNREQFGAYELVEFAKRLP